MRHLLDLVAVYQASVQEAIELFQRHKGLSPPTEAREWMDRCQIYGELPQRGYIDESQTIPYSLHGIGCGAKLLMGGADWDFGYQGRYDGFDPWKLWHFAKWHLDIFPEFQHKEALYGAFNDAKTKGIFNQAYLEFHDYLYYRQNV